MQMATTTMSMMSHMHNHTNQTGMGHDGMNHTGMDHSDTDHSGKGHSMDMGHSGMGHSMKMYFHEGYEEYVLFQDLYTKSKEAMIGACFAIFVLAILYEGLKFLREVLLQRALLARGPGTYMESKLPAGSSQEQMVMQTRAPTIANRMLTGSHFIQTLLHIVQVFISYCLMLVFMTYNIWLCLAVVLGAGVGYFLFGWKRAVVVDSNEHCH